MNMPDLKCPKHRIVIDAENPLCLECHFPLKCPRHMERVNLANRCERCGRMRDDRRPAPPRPHPNRCHGHMIESDRNGNCGYCGRPAGDESGPRWSGYPAALRQWEEAVQRAGERLAQTAE